MERFFYQNRKKGHPPISCSIWCWGPPWCIFSSAIGRNYVLYDLLCFDRDSILHGQVGRLLTYPLTFDAGGLLFTAISLLCYYSIGRAMENIWHMQIQHFLSDGHRNDGHLLSAFSAGKRTCTI